MFESLSDKLSNVFRNISGQGKLSTENIQESLKQIRLALLEADVNFKVVKSFVAAVEAKCIGQEVPQGINPAQHVVKIVHDELVTLLGGETTSLNLGGTQPAVIMMVGLQGSGKTTSSGKIANLLRKQKMRPYLVPVDVYRPAAIEQLIVLAKQLDLPYYPSTIDMNPVSIAKAAVEMAKQEQATVVLLDTAGRLHIDETLMQELVAIKEAVNPQEILFVADAMTGQDAVNVAQVFNEQLGITGVILTKMDGDARGGVALSIKSVTGVAVKYVGMGEKLSEIEVFHPDRIAGRILGMGDVLTLIEKAQTTFEAEESEALALKMQKNQFTLEDFQSQMKKIKQMGSLDSILKMIPGMGGIREKLSNASGAVPEKEMQRTEAIINSMTIAEKRKPEILNGSRRARIAKGSGTTVQQINQLIRQFEQMRQMMKNMLGGGGLGGKKMPKGLGGMGGMQGMGNFGMGSMPGLNQLPKASGSATKKIKKRKERVKVKRNKKK